MDAFRIYCMFASLLTKLINKPIDENDNVKLECDDGQCFESVPSGSSAAVTFGCLLMMKTLLNTTHCHCWGRFLVNNTQRLNRSARACVGSTPLMHHPDDLKC